MKNNEIEVASKNLTSSNIYELNANVKFDEEKGKIPVVESIYDENRLYSKTYIIEDEIDETEKKYDVNFYRMNEKIICEFAYCV